MIIRGTGTDTSPGVQTVTKQQSIIVIRSDEGTTTVEKKDGHTHHGNVHFTL